MECSDIVQLTSTLANGAVQRTTYRLRAVVFHAGSSIRSGHYASCVRRGGKWYAVNDTSVRQVASVEPAVRNGRPYLVSTTHPGPVSRR
jgi:uncharacterized UBP type Zn finger protein